MICENCGKEHDGSYGSGRFCSNHCRHSYNAKKRKTNPSLQQLIDSGFIPKAKEGGWKCSKCNLVFRTRGELQAHRRQEHSNRTSWNKGKNAKTDLRLAKSGKTYSKHIQQGIIIPYNRGKHLSKTIKNKISAKLKLYYRQHPEKLFYIINHSSHINYAEQYFTKIFKTYGLVLQRNFYHLGYFLDFANIATKVDVEIDGSQHKNDSKIIKHDNKRNRKLILDGWKVIRIYWPDWKCLDKSTKEIIVSKILNYIKNPNTLSRNLLKIEKSTIRKLKNS